MYIRGFMGSGRSNCILLAQGSPSSILPGLCLIVGVGLLVLCAVGTICGLLGRRAASSQDTIRPRSGSLLWFAVLTAGPAVLCFAFALFVLESSPVHACRNSTRHVVLITRDAVSEQPVHTNASIGDLFEDPDIVLSFGETAPGIMAVRTNVDVELSLHASGYEDLKVAIAQTSPEQIVVHLKLIHAPSTEGTR